MVRENFMPVRVASKKTLWSLVCN